MRFMVMVKATKNSEAGTLPKEELLAEMGRFNEELVKAVGSETRRHHYDEVILPAGRQRGNWLARSLHLDPIHQLRRKVQRLVILPPGSGAKPNQ